MSTQCVIIISGMTKEQKIAGVKAFQDIVRVLSILMVAGFILWLFFHHTVHVGTSLVHSMTNPMVGARPG